MGFWVFRFLYRGWRSFLVLVWVVDNYVRLGIRDFVGFEVFILEVVVEEWVGLRIVLLFKIVGDGE